MSTRRAGRGGGRGAATGRGGAAGRTHITREASLTDGSSSTRGGAGSGATAGRETAVPIPAVLGRDGGFVTLPIPVVMGQVGNFATVSTLNNQVVVGVVVMAPAVGGTRAERNADTRGIQVVHFTNEAVVQEEVHFEPERVGFPSK